MRLIAGMCIVWMFGTGAFAEAVNITGTVKDGKGAAIANAVVTLMSDQSIKDSTNANGEFTISNITPIKRNGVSGNLVQSTNSVLVKGNQLVFSIGSFASTGIVSIYSSNGKRNAHFLLSKMEPGIHKHTLPELSPGIYVMHFAIDQFETTLRLATTGNGIFMCSDLSNERGSFELSRSAAVAIDTIKVEKEGFKKVNKEITSYDQKDISIVMEAESTGPTLPPITDYSVKGPFKTVVEKNVGPNNKYTVFRPDPLGQDGFLHAPIVFGPGIGQTVQPIHTELLTNFASHGFVVVGTPVLNQGPGGAQNLKTMQDGLDWIVKQNTTDGIYKGKLWTDHAVSMGFSVGGTSAVQLGGAQAVFTVVSIHGHTAEAALHGPLFQTTGTKDNVGMPLQQATYNSSKVQTFMATLIGAPHGYIESNGGGEERKAILAWLRYWIYNDTGAKNYFYGNDCVLCKTPWQNPQRKNWK